MTHGDISIHAPRAGRDRQKQRVDPMYHEFQSTRPVRGATINDIILIGLGKISIHAPRAGRDPP